MKIIPIHKAPSRRVTSWGQIKADAGELERIVQEVVNGRKSVAIHHSQASKEPFNFFVIHPEMKKAGVFDDLIIINPEIETHDEAGYMQFDKKTMIEGCMSFPFRPYKKMSRYTGVAVTYEVPGLFGLKKKHTVFNGFAAQVFQHESDHAKGRNIYE